MKVNSLKTSGSTFSTTCLSTADSTAGARVNSESKFLVSLLPFYRVRKQNLLKLVTKLSELNNFNIENEDIAFLMYLSLV